MQFRPLASGVIDNLSSKTISLFDFFRQDIASKRKTRKFIYCSSLARFSRLIISKPIFLYNKYFLEKTYLFSLAQLIRLNWFESNFKKYYVTHRIIYFISLVAISSLIRFPKKINYKSSILRFLSIRSGCFFL